MSHFVILVIGSDVETQLAPYNEQPDDNDPLCPTIFEDKTEKYQKEYDTGSDSRKVRHNIAYKTFEEFCKDWHSYEPNAQGRYGYASNPNAKWDWYEIGGRWSGYFKAKSGAKGVLGTPSWGIKEVKPGWYDEIKKGDIDFCSMATEARKQANKNYDLYEQTVAGLEVPKTWDEFRKDFENISEARKAYSALPYNEVLSNTELYDWSTNFVETYGAGRDVYVTQCLYGSFVPYAVLKDGKWISKGEMGWFGISTDSTDQNAWDEQIAKLLHELPDDTLITAVDCHI